MEYQETYQNLKVIEQDVLSSNSIEFLDLSKPSYQQLEFRPAKEITIPSIPSHNQIIKTEASDIDILMFFSMILILIFSRSIINGLTSILMLIKNSTLLTIRKNWNFLKSLLNKVILNLPLLIAKFPRAFFLIIISPFLWDYLTIKKNVNSKLKSFKYLIPAQHREEIIGDLYETESELLKEGYSKRWIRVILFWKIVIILFASLKIRLADLYKSKKQGTKN